MDRAVWYGQAAARIKSGLFWMETPDMSIKLRLCAEIRQLWGRGTRDESGWRARAPWISCHLISRLSHLKVPTVSESGRA